MNAMQRLNEIVNRKGPLIIDLEPDWKTIYPLWKAKGINRPLYSGHAEKVKFEEKVFKIICKEYLGKLADTVGAVKISGGFFELHGMWDLFWELCKYAQKLGYFVIADLNLASIGNMLELYSKKFLGKSSPIDAITVTPYFGTDGVKPFLDMAKENGKGVFIVVKTANPSAYELQDVMLKDDVPYYERVAEQVRKWGELYTADDEDYSLVGAVVGTKNPEQAGKLRHIMPNNLILVPEYSKNGINGIANNFDAKGCGAVVTSSDLFTAWTNKRLKGKYTKAQWAEAAKEEAIREQAELESEICFYLEQTEQD